MKKTIFTLIALGLFTQTTQAQSLNCSAKNTIAVDKYGTCRIYSNPCQIPSEWRVLPVDSCENVESTDTGKTTSTVADRRINLINRAKKQRAEANKDTSLKTSYSKVGKALYTRRNAQNYQDAKVSEPETNKRTFRSSLGSFQVKQRAYEEQRDPLNQETPSDYENKGLRRPAIISNTRSIREGNFKNEPSYIQRQAQRYTKSTETIGKRSPYWKSMQQTLAEKKEVKEYTPRKISPRKTFRGYENERRNASLDNMTNRSE